MQVTKKWAYISALTATALVTAACGGSSSTGSTSGSAATPGSSSASVSSSPSASSSSSSGSGSGSGSASMSAASVQMSASSIKRDFSSMTALKPVAAAGKGKIAVILPDTVSSARYTEFDAPYMKKAFEAAGLTSATYSIQNAQGSDSTQLTDAQAAISSGASVLVVDPIDPGVGKRIEAYAKQHNVPVVDYDRITLGGSRSYYVSFNNVQVGKLIGNGLVSCAKAWGVSKPNVIVMRGAATDNNATQFAQGYNGVLAPLFKSGGWVQAATPAGTWDPPTALTEFTQAFTQHSSTNAVLVPNDENAAPIITYLKTHKVAAKKFPVTGQDATLAGLQNILGGYQCGTAYKPIYLETQAAAALALYLRANQKPPAALVNGSTMDTAEHTSVPSVLLTPVWVTAANMKSTIIADNFVPAKQICTAAYAAACKSAGISK